MGLLADRWETRNKPEWLNDDDSMYDGPLSSAGVRVSRATAIALPAVFRCWDLLSSAIAMAPRDVIVKLGGKSFPEFTPPSWVNTPNANNPNYNGNDYFAGVTLSLLAAGEFFTYVVPDVSLPLGLTLIDPALVDVRGTISEPLYDIKDRSGRVVLTVGPEKMLHGTWMRMPGGLRGISPLEALRTAFGAAIATQEHAARFFGQGASLSFGVEVPGPMDDIKKKEMRESLRRKYTGLTNAHAIGVLTHNAKFVTGLSPTPEQAQFLASREFSVEDVCRIYGVPPAMAGSTQPGAASFASTDNYDKWFAQRAVQPLAERIETAHDRLLALPSGLTADGATVQFKFNLASIERSTLLTRYQAHSEGVRGGFLTPNEARTHEDLAPLDGGELLYMQQQMVPLADLGKTKATEPLVTQPAPAGEQRAAAETIDRVIELMAHRSEPVINVSPEGTSAALIAQGEAIREISADIRSLKTEPAVVNVTVPDFPAPIVNVPAPIVNVPAPIVNLPVVKAPEVTVNVDSVRVTSMPTRKHQLVRDRTTGKPVGSTETDA